MAAYVAAALLQQKQQNEATAAAAANSSNCVGGDHTDGDVSAGLHPREVNIEMAESLEQEAVTKENEHNSNSLPTSGSNKGNIQCPVTQDTLNNTANINVSDSKDCDLEAITKSIIELNKIADANVNNNIISNNNNVNDRRVWAGSNNISYDTDDDEEGAPGVNGYMRVCGAGDECSGDEDNITTSSTDNTKKQHNSNNNNINNTNIVMSENDVRIPKRSGEPSSASGGSSTSGPSSPTTAAGELYFGRLYFRYCILLSLHLYRFSIYLFQEHFEIFPRI